MGITWGLDALETVEREERAGVSVSSKPRRSTSWTLILVSALRGGDTGAGEFLALLLRRLLRREERPFDFGVWPAPPA